MLLINSKVGNFIWFYRMPLSVYYEVIKILWSLNWNSITSGEKSGFLKNPRQYNKSVPDSTCNIRPEIDKVKET